MESLVTVNAKTACPVQSAPPKLKTTTKMADFFVCNSIHLNLNELKLINAVLLDSRSRKVTHKLNL